MYQLPPQSKKRFIETKGNDKQGNFLSNVAGQSCRAIVAWSLSH